VDLTDQVAFITGGASGIGRAVATALAGEGLRTVIGDLNPEVETIARKIGAAKGLHVDVRKPEQVEQAIRTIRGEFGALHVLGNIAGTFIRATTAALAPEQWDETLDTNLKGPFLCTHFALAVMVEQGYGRIVSIASGYGVVGGAEGSAYAASKGGLLAFTKSTAAEVFNQGVTVNCIAPGITDTPLMRSILTPPEIEAAVARAGRPLGKPDDVVAPFLFLISDAAKTISGITFWMKNP